MFAAGYSCDKQFVIHMSKLVGPRISIYQLLLFCYDIYIAFLHWNCCWCFISCALEVSYVLLATWPCSNLVDATNDVDQ